MFGNFLATILMTTLNLLVVTMTGVLRLLPAFMKATRSILEKFIELSNRFYQLILDQLSPFFARRWGIDIQSGLLRLLSTNLLSLVFGCLLFILLGLPITLLGIGVCLVHGMVTGLMGQGSTQEEDDFFLGKDVE